MAASDKQKAKKTGRKKDELKAGKKAKVKAKLKAGTKGKAGVGDKKKAKAGVKAGKKAKAETKLKAGTKGKAGVGDKKKAEAVVKAGKKAKAKTRLKAGTKGKTGVGDKKKAKARADEGEGRISKTIQEMTRSGAVLPGESNLSVGETEPGFDGAGADSAMCAKDIMQTDIVWCGPEYSVQQVLAEMEQHGTGYVLVGRDGVAEGIVSRSDLKGAVSPYLQPIFAKWRRPLDDATLQIKVKWIMSSSVHTIRAEMSIGAVMENMCRLNLRAMPVVDEQGKVQGLVTVFDIFEVLQRGCSEAPVAAAAEVSSLV